MSLFFRLKAIYRRATLRCLCGLGCLIGLNLFFPITGMLFELNYVTCSIAGLLGLPGVGALLILHSLLSGFV